MEKLRAAYENDARVYDASFAHEKEVVIPGLVLPSDIVGYYKVDKLGAMSEFIPNKKNYKGPTYTP